MFHEDMNEDDNNELSTNGNLRTDNNTTTITTDALGSTRVNTIIEMPRKLERKTKHQQAMDLVKKRKLAINSHHGISTPLPQYWEIPSITWCQLIEN